MVDLLGVPHDHLLRAGKYSQDYFVQNPVGHWRMKVWYKISVICFVAVYHHI